MPLLIPNYALVCLTIIALSAGCSDNRPERVPISGQVLIDGKPLNRGTVQVIPEQGRPAYGRLDNQGRFTLGTFSKDDGCPTGKHSVAIVAKEMLGPTKVRWLIPKKYSQPETSGLTIEAHEPTDGYIIQLQGDGGKPFEPFIETIDEE